MSNSQTKYQLDGILKAVPAGSTAYLVNPSMKIIKNVAEIIVPSVETPQRSYSTVQGTIQLVVSTELGPISSWDPKTALRLGSASDASAIDIFRHNFNKTDSSFLLTTKDIVVFLTNSVITVIPKKSDKRIFTKARKHTSNVVSNSSLNRTNVSINSLAEAPNKHLQLSHKDIYISFETAQSLKSTKNADTVDMLMIMAAYRQSPRRPVRKFLVNAGICSRRTVQRRYKSLRDDDWISKGKTRIQLSRPIIQLLPGRRINDAKSATGAAEMYARFISEKNDI